jgi:hypothetical protein
VYKVLNLRVSQEAWNLLLAKWLLGTQEGLCSMKLLSFSYLVNVIVVKHVAVKPNGVNKSKYEI